MPDLYNNSLPAWTPNHIPPFLLEGSRNRQFVISQARYTYRQDPSRRHLSLTSPKQTQADPRYLVEVLGVENLVFPWDAVHVHEEVETELQV